MSKTTTKDAVQAALDLIARAEEARSADDALKFSQAACNSANALRALEGADSLKAHMG